MKTSWLLWDLVPLGEDRDLHLPGPGKTPRGSQIPDLHLGKLQPTFPLAGLSIGLQ